jgi:uncharacterized membrane protein YvbJ
MNICRKCGHQLEEGIGFCGKCGSAVSQSKACGKCQAEMSAELLFCDKCGAKYEEAAKVSNNDSNEISVKTLSEQLIKPLVEKKVSKEKLFMWLNLGLGLLGVIIAVNTYTFGFGEILMFAAVGFGIAMKKPLGYVLAGIDFFLFIAIWFF